MRTPASQFVDALEEALSGGGRARGPVSVRRAVRVLNLAEVNADPIAKVVLAVSAIEGLAADSPWTAKQERLIRETVDWLKEARGDGEGAQRVVDAVEGLLSGSIGARVRRMLRTNGLGDLVRPWNKLYGRRSRLFHGDTGKDREHSGEHLDESDLHTLEATGDIRKVSLWLGHASIKSAEAYLRMDPVEKLEILAARPPPSIVKGSFPGATDRLLAVLADGRSA